MKQQPKWQYDEMNQCGIDFADPKEVERYESQHQRLRDFKQETESLLDALALGAEDQVIDFGCGTGAFAFHAADKCRKIYAVDVSEAMLEFCKEKYRKAAIKNVEFHRAGFLTYEHKAEPVDAIIVKMALHHLPDFWKLVALRRLAAMLKPGGKLYLYDVVFSFDITDYDKSIEHWIKTTVAHAGKEFKQRIETHIGTEFSTFNWIMEGLLEKSGFKIDTVDYKDSFMATHICTKKD